MWSRVKREKDLLGYARRLLALNDEAVGEVRRHEVEGVVRVGVMDDYGVVLMPPLIASFAAGYPRVHVEMETGLTATMTERLGKAYDLVVAMHPEDRGEGQFLRREQAIWAAGPSPSALEQDPLPLALYPQGCLFRSWAIEALDRAERRWRLAFVSHSLAAVEAIALQGLAVTVVKAGTFPPKLRALSEKDGMPRLPTPDIRLHRAPSLSKAALLLADHFAAGIARPG